MKMNVLDWITFVLVIVGGLNWGLWGALEFDLVAEVFGGNTETLSKVVYILVGVSAVYLVISFLTKGSGSKSMQQPMA